MAVAPATADRGTAPAQRAPDVISDRASPPLSAVSDMPLASVPRPPVSASADPGDRANGIPAEMTAEEQAAARSAKVGTKPAAEPTPEPAETKPPPAETKPADPDAPSGLPKDTPPWMVREVTIARRQAREARAAAKEASDSAAAATRALEELRAAAPKPTEPTPEAAPAAKPRPARDAFDTPEAYDDALATWGVEEGQRLADVKAAADKLAADKAAAERTAAEKAEAERKAQDAQRAATETETARLNTEWEAKRTAALDKYPDFEDVVYADSALNIPAPMAHAILVAPNGADVAYHLAKNPDEAARISALKSVGEQLFEMGRLSATLDAPAPRRARPPAPIEPVEGGANPADTSERELDMDAYAKKREGELYGNRKPFIMADPAAFRRQATAH